MPTVAGEKREKKEEVRMLSNRFLGNWATNPESVSSRNRGLKGGEKREGGEHKARFRLWKWKGEKEKGEGKKNTPGNLLRKKHLSG